MTIGTEEWMKGEKMAEDYCISWGEIVRMMESVHGIKPDSKTKESFGYFERKLRDIWNIYYSEKRKEENK